MLAQIQKFSKYLILFLAVPVLLFALYTWASLTLVYSLGERASYVQKLPKKGWLCKTYEGELILVSMPGTQAENFCLPPTTKMWWQKSMQLSASACA